jgi:putative transposase
MRLKATRKQSEILSRLLAQLCELYNMALEQKRNVWKSHRLSIGLNDQMKQLTELRAGSEEYASFPVMIQRDPLRRLDLAFKDFFRRTQSGEKPGYPRFRSSARYDSFTVPNGYFSLSDTGLALTRLGTFQVKTRHKIRGNPLGLRVKRSGQQWTAQMVCEIGPAPEKVSVRSAVGIDLGITTLATLSDGTEIANPRWKQEEENRLATANRDLSQKKIGSNNRAKSKQRLRRIHERISGKRSAYLHDVSRQLIGCYDLIAHEELKIEKMSQSRFGKGIMDAAWGILIHQLTYKAEEAGKHLVSVDPRGTTQLCSGCGEKVPKKIWQRVHDCSKCGLTLSRDHNAALNVLERGIRSVAL